VETASGHFGRALCTHHYLDPAVAHKKEEEAREAGEFGEEMGWSAKPLAASGYSIVGLLCLTSSSRRQGRLCNAYMGDSKLKSSKASG
jgi:hypothetical protein